MMHWESATKEIQKELCDPDLLVEFNEATQKYEIMKWIPRTRYQNVPGFLFGSKEEVVRIGVPSGYYSTQMVFDAWDGRVIEAMRRGRPERWDPKRVLQDHAEDEYKVKKSQKAEMRDLQSQTVKNMHRRLRPTVYSFPPKG